MNDLSPKERILRKLKKQTTDRPPVICPGGMMNSAIVEIMNITGHHLPDGHLDNKIMTELAKDIHEYTGFENFGIPFCLTLEAEVLGSEINYGTLACEPKIQKEAFASVADVQFKKLGAMEKNSRVNSVLETIRTLQGAYSDVPVIGSVTGPVSAAASIVDPILFLKELITKSSRSHEVIDYSTNHIIELARLMVENGADVITIADPTATGEILGPKLFDAYAVRYLNKLIDAIHEMNTPVILHICGKMNAVKKYIPTLHCDAISTDSLVNLKLLKDEYNQLTTMGNLSTILLELGDEDKVANQTSRLIGEGIDIISPACGLSTSTPLKNIKSMTKVVKES